MSLSQRLTRRDQHIPDRTLERPAGLVLRCRCTDALEACSAAGEYEVPCSNRAFRLPKSGSGSQLTELPQPTGDVVPTRERQAQLLSLSLESLTGVVLRRSGFGLRPRLSGTIPTRLTTESL